MRRIAAILISTTIAMGATCQSSSLLSETGRNSISSTRPTRTNYPTELGTLKGSPLASSPVPSQKYPMENLCASLRPVRSGVISVANTFAPHPGGRRASVAMSLLSRVFATATNPNPSLARGAGSRSALGTGKGVSTARNPQPSMSATGSVTCQWGTPIPKPTDAVSAGMSSISNAHIPDPVPARVGVTPATPGATRSAGYLDDHIESAREAFLACVVQAESGGDPTAQNPTSSASGLFGDLDSTWGGYGGYQHAREAPPAVQWQMNEALYDEAGRSPWSGDGC